MKQPNNSLKLARRAALSGCFASVASRTVTFHRYSGTGHWFFEPDRAQTYNQAAASLAWDRTLAFLKGPSTL